MEHALWIGGPPGSGKTTVATRLVRRHGLCLYSADTQTWAHRDRALLAGNQAAARWEALAPAERWTQPPAELLAMSLHHERGPMVVDDVRRLPHSPLIVAEGSPVSPDLVGSGAAERSRGVWLLPTPEVQRARLEGRGLPRGVADLYRLVAADLERAAAEHRVTVLTVDGSRGVDETVAAVEDVFAAPLAAGPRAATLPERRALLHEANAAIAEQVRGYYARPWADGDADTISRPFLCECGEPGCEASVELAVGSFDTGPVLAAGHS